MDGEGGVKSGDYNSDNTLFKTMVTYIATWRWYLTFEKAMQGYKHDTDTN